MPAPGLARLVDRALEASVVGSFSRAGYAVRSRLEPWPDPPSQVGRVHVVTGASSGIGAAVARRLGHLGAEVWVVGRDEARTGATADSVRSAGGQAEVAIADVTDADAVATLGRRLAARHTGIHGLVHAAGALAADYRTAADGMEMTVATAVIAPFRLTATMAPLLEAGAANVVTVSSGGMYTQRFDLDQLVSVPDHYDGVQTYARAKRAQVVLSHEWARRFGPLGVASYACHPGWVDTPGLATGLPSFSRLGPLLRTAEQGADTAAWLAAGGARQGTAESPALTEGFFHDRRLRTEYRLSRTRPANAVDDGARLWSWCEEVAADAPPLPTSWPGRPG
jgi:dehydrogenase/reductase SDR family member 12